MIRDVGKAIAAAILSVALLLAIVVAIGIALSLSTANDDLLPFFVLALYAGGSVVLVFHWARHRSRMGYNAVEVWLVAVAALTAAATVLLPVSLLVLAM